MVFSAYRLLLYPTQATNIPLQPLLQDSGLLGMPLATGHFATGENFLDQICFLGCSPDIVLTPCANQAFCYVQLPTDNTPTTFHPIRKPPLILPQWAVIGNIHEAEAIPHADLLGRLETATACRWKHTYLRPV